MQCRLCQPRRGKGMSTKQEEELQEDDQDDGWLAGLVGGALEAGWDGSFPKAAPPFRGAEPLPKASLRGSAGPLPPPSDPTPGSRRSSRSRSRSRRERSHARRASVRNRVREMRYTEEVNCQVGELKRCRRRLKQADQNMKEAKYLAEQIRGPGQAEIARARAAYRTYRAERDRAERAASDVKKTLRKLGQLWVERAIEVALDGTAILPQPPLLPPPLPQLDLGEARGD